MEIFITRAEIEYVMNKQDIKQDVEVSEETSKRRFAANRCIEFTLGTRCVYTKERQLPTKFKFRGEGYIRELLFVIFKEKRHVVQESDKKKGRVEP